MPEGRLCVLGVPPKAASAEPLPSEYLEYPSRVQTRLETRTKEWGLHARLRA